MRGNFSIMPFCVFKKRLMIIIFLLTLINLNLIIYSQEKNQLITLEPLEDRWAVIIGISKYQNSKINLKYPDNDAEAFKQALLEKSRFKKEQTKLLLNEAATYENIRRSIEGWLYNNTGKDDKIIIFFSGHGTQDIDNNKDEKDGYDEFLVPYDFDENDISSAIRDDVFAYWINNLKSDNVLLIFDCCYSGGAARAKGFNHVKTRGEIKVDSFVEDIKELPGEGVALLGASKDNQLSYETGEFNMGVFTHFLIDSFEKKSDRNLDDKLTVHEIYEALRLKVKKYTISKFKREQEPVFISTLNTPYELIFFPIELKDTSEKIKQEVEKIIWQSTQTRNIERKIELLKEAMRLDSSNGRVRMHLAYAYIEIESYKDALNQYDILLSMDSIYSKGFIFFKKSEAHNKMGENQKAIDCAQKAIVLDKNDERYFNHIASLFNKNHNFNEAIDNYLHSININNRQAEPYFELGRLYIKQRKYDDAFSIIERGIKINPDYNEFYYLKGLLHKYVKNEIEIGNELIEQFHKKDLYIYIGVFNDSPVMWKDKEWREKIVKETIEDIRNDTFLIEPYIRMIIISLNYPSEKINTEEYFDMLIFQYPFLEKDEEINSLMKKRH